MRVALLQAVQRFSSAHKWGQKQTFQNKPNKVQKPNWSEANLSTIYRLDQRIEFRITMKRSSYIFRACSSYMYNAGLGLNTGQAFGFQGPVVRKVANTIHWNLYPVVSTIDFFNTYPLDGDLSAGLHYPTFEQLEPVLLCYTTCICIKKTTTTTQRQMYVSVVSYTSLCSSNQLHRGQRKYYCIKICCNQLIQSKVYRMYCAHNVSLENVQHYCMPNRL